MVLGPRGCAHRKHFRYGSTVQCSRTCCAISCQCTTVQHSSGSPGGPRGCAHRKHPRWGTPGGARVHMCIGSAVHRKCGTQLPMQYSVVLYSSVLYTVQYGIGGCLCVVVVLCSCALSLSLVPAVKPKEVRDTITRALQDFPSNPSLLRSLLHLEGHRAHLSGMRRALDAMTRRWVIVAWLWMQRHGGG